MIDVLELLARQPGGVPLAELTRMLGLTKGTAHAILSTLRDRGWVTRDPIDRTLSLGPALGIAAATIDRVRPLASAARVMAVGIAEDIGEAVSVVERVGDSIVIVAFEGGTGEHRATPGDRVPFGAPLGLGFAAWSPEEVRRRWIERGAGDDPALAGRLTELIDVTRRRGYTVERMSPTYVQTAQLMATLRDDELSEPVRRAVDAMLADLTAIVLQTDHRAGVVTAIAAPVFDERAQAILNIAVHPSRSLSDGELDTMGRRLAHDCRRVTESVRDQIPNRD